MDYIQYVLDSLFELYDIIEMIMRRICAYYKIDKNKDFHLMKSMKSGGILSKIDQIDLYISYLKMINSLILAGMNAYKGPNDFALPVLSSFKMTSGKIEFDGNKLDNKVNETKTATSPLVGPMLSLLRSKFV